MRIGLLLVFFLPITTLAAAPSPKSRLSSLEERLNAGGRNDPPLKLRLGKDFAATPGEVVFLSRRQGLRRMLRLARSGEPELSILYLPRWRAWLTVTTFRGMEDVKSDERFVESALLAEPLVEIWHTHNDVGESEAEQADHARLTRIWTMPSETDVLQLYEYAREIPRSKLCGVVVSVHGRTAYWSDDPTWGLLIYQRFAAKQEAHQFELAAGEVPLSQLPQLARSHRGFIRLRFRPIP